MTERIMRRATALDVTLFGGLVLSVVLMLGSVLSIPLRIPINYNEGWNALFDARAVGLGSGPLYPGPDSLVFDNYPPLGFLVVGAIGRFVFAGAMIEAGRVVALLSLLATAGLTGYAARALGASTRAGMAAALLLVLITATYYRAYVAMDDPQWLAHATMLAGLAVLLAGGGVSRLRAGGMGWGRIALAAGLVAAGGFIKHNLVALPLALTIWLVWLDRRTGLVFVIAAAAWVAIGLGLVRLGYGHAAFEDVLHHRRVFHAGLMVTATVRLLPMLAAAIVVAVQLRRRAAGDGAVFAWWFVAIALVTGTLQRMAEGVSYNAHFETLIAVCLGFGLALDHLPRGRPVGPALVCLFAASPVIGAAYWHLPIAWHDVVDRHEREAAYRPIIARLAAARGPIVCEMMSLCLWAGQDSAADLFNLTQSALVAGGLTAGPLDRFRDLAAHRAFALIEDQPKAMLHREAIHELGRDPVTGLVARAYGPVLEAPDGRVLLAPLGRD